VAKARELGLARSSPWIRLLLYQPKNPGRWKSQVDGADFFLAKDGRTNPGTELEATLAAFFLPAEPGKEDEHALCKFPARRRWLDSQLHFESELMRRPRCPKLERYVAEIDADAATFVYAANFLDNPASAFGHTLLRLKKRIPAGPPVPGMSADKRDHGIDYTAATDTDNPLLYAFKGLAGMFPGTFRFRPYEVMVRDYAGSESRDLWEYELALTQAEVDLLVAHLWELANTDIDYLYLTENCSYQIIAAIDAAAPRLDLVASVKANVLPLDTVRAVAGSPGLVRSVVYRPSVRSLFRVAVAKLSGPERDVVTKLLVDADAPLPAALSDADAAQVLDAALLGVDERFAKELIERRRRITSVTRVTPIDGPPYDKAPHRSHGSMRAMLGTGMTSQLGTGFGTLGYRVALHDLADPPDGEPELVQLQFLDTRLRYDYGRQRLTLDSLTFAELMALKPMSRFEKHLSWRARGYGLRLHDRDAPDGFAHGANVAIGAAFATANEHAVVFLMADTHVLFSSQMSGIAGSFVRTGVGPLAGVRVRLPLDTIALVTGTVSYLPGADLYGTFDVRASLRSRLAPNVAMGLEGSAQPRAFELQLASYLFF
jgi:hypothetical protein